MLPPLTGTDGLAGPAGKPPILQHFWQQRLQSQVDDFIKWLSSYSCDDHCFLGTLKIYEGCLDPQHFAPDPDGVGDCACSCCRRSFADLGLATSPI